VKRSHVVSILNQKLAVRGEDDEEYVKKIADFVECNVKEVLEKSKTASQLTAALLACLNIADELFRTRESKSKEVREVAQKVKGLIARIDAHLEEESQSAIAG
jgi:cell division protein ZapA